ncbi:chaperonin GroEL, partial [Mycobacterium kansasii]
GRGIGAAADKAAEILISQATPVDGEKAIAQVATVSSRDAELGEMIGSAMTKVGADGVVTIEESSGVETDVVVTEGV